ncbi:glutamic-type intramembrane protease PrsW [Peribacillus deserti]|uniref:Protease PrsW n=1 Tax=Peribacillus deserti TaxID=673318 RepID=A0A2N5M208_9BACI|nr:glutamic-type intramembrane protease PrsW [Peribacillus deserti]PLT28313.1 PrsW family intramembrane metalloprotease [Peribacillus deserti]
MLVILAAGFAPGLALLSFFYLKDYYGTEPLSVVSKAFIFGAVLVLPIMFLEYILKTENIIMNHFSTAFLSAGLIEEFFKWFILFYVIYNHVEFDEPYDGIVYGAAVSLGFATLENIFYLIGNGVDQAIGRALLPVSSHALFGVIMGYYFGRGKFTNKNKHVYISLAFVVPYLLHGIYDYILLTQEYWGYWMLPFMVFLWWYGLKKVKMARVLSDIHASQLL